MLNNVLGTLKYDITAGALSLVIQPISATSFVLPPSGTNAAAGTPTYGKPIETIILADRLDLSQAKYEILQCTLAVAELGGAFTYTVNTVGRGAEGSAAQAWVAANTVYAFQLTTAGMLDLLANGWAARAQHMLTHIDTGVLSWDATTFKFAVFRATCLGRGSHASVSGFMDIAMPANGSTAVGYGGAANCVAALGGWPLLGNSTLYYEPNLSGDLSISLAANFRVVGFSTNFVVPPHWIMIATRINYSGPDGIRVCNGGYLPYWHLVGTGGEPAFQNGWVNYGSPAQDVRFTKDASGWVTIEGSMKSGTTTSSTVITTIPAGYRPAGLVLAVVNASGTFGEIRIDASGSMYLITASATITTFSIRYLAAS